LVAPVPAVIGISSAPRLLGVAVSGGRRVLPQYVSDRLNRLLALTPPCSAVAAEDA